MATRTRRETVVFGSPFLLKDIGRTLPAGGYEVLTDEELIEGLSFPVYRRVSTMMMVPAAAATHVFDRNADHRSARTAAGAGSRLCDVSAGSRRRACAGSKTADRLSLSRLRAFQRQTFQVGTNKHSGPLSIHPAALYVQVTPADELHAGAERRDSAPAHTGGACAQLSSLPHQQ